PVLPKHWHLACAPLRLRNQLPEHIRQNATVSVVFNLDWCIDTQDYGNVLCRAVRTVDNERQILSWLDVVRETNEIECLSAIEFERLCIGAIFELAGQHSHAN